MLENLRTFLQSQEIKGIKSAGLRQDQLEQNEALFQLWDGYRDPKDGQYPIGEDLAAMLEEAGFNIDVLSQQRVRAITMEEALEFRKKYSIPENTRIKGEAYPHDSNGNSWLHAMDWVLAKDRANIMYRISIRPRSTVIFGQAAEETERYYSFYMNHTGGGGETIGKYKRVKGKADRHLPAILSEDRDALAAIYLVPDKGSDKGATFWSQWSPNIARPSSKSNYTDFSFYGTFENCGGAFYIKPKQVEDIIKESKYEQYLHVYMLER